MGKGQPETEQMLYKTFSLVAASNGVVMARDPRMTLNDATNTTIGFLLGMDVPS